MDELNTLTLEAAAALVACAVAGMAGARFGMQLGHQARGAAVYAASAVVGIASGAVALSVFLALS
jgi:hypothetical protein